MRVHDRFQGNRDLHVGGDARQLPRCRQKLNTTQPAISQRIAQLEREVGVKLLQRDRRDGAADAERAAD